jgi:transposase
MPGLEAVAPEDLREALEDVDGWRRTRRLVAALLYACGFTGPEIAEVFDVREATVYGWLDRFEGASDLERAAADAPRSGRPPRLGADERAALLEALRDPPAESGYAADRWTPRLVRDHLAAAFGVEYSLRHARRLLADAARGVDRPEG